MKKLILIIMLAFTGTIVNSQNCFWAKSFGGNNDDVGQSIATDANGNLYVTGYFYSNSITFGSTMLTGGYFIVKYSPDGIVLWAKGATGGAQGFGLTLDALGNVYVTGQFSDATATFGSEVVNGNAVGYNDFFAVKYDTNGNVIWANGGGGDSYDFGSSIAVDDGGNVYITGNFYSSSITFGGSTITNAGTSNTDYYIAKFDAVGNAVWAESAGGTRYEYGNGITSLNGKIYVTGNFQSDSITLGSFTLHNDEPGNDVQFIACYDSGSNVLWAEEIDGMGGSVIGNSIAQDISGNLYTCGEFHSYYLVFGNDTLYNYSSGSSDVLIVKYDSTGNVLWARSAKGDSYDYGKDVAVDSSGNAVITGYFNSYDIVFENDTLINSSSNDPEIFVAKYDSVGNLLWAIKAGGTGMDFGFGIASGIGDNVYFTGNYGSSPASFGNINLNPVGYVDMYVADVYNFFSGISSFTDATCYGANNGTAFTTASGGSLPYTYIWNTTPVQTTPNVINLSAGNYSVTIAEAFGCAQTHSVTINEPLADSANICLVTVDSLSRHNIIVWDKTPFTAVDSFIVYREISTNDYQPIARIPYDSLSQFIDTVRTLYFPNTGDPNTGTYRYKIQCHDTCGTYNVLSPFHNTIYFMNSSGMFTWPQLYTIENETNPVGSYVLMRDDSSNGNWHAIGSVAGTQQFITDPQYSQYQNTASWRIKTQWSISCTPTYKLSTAYAASFSNVFTNVHVGLNENSFDNLVNIYPNPANDKIDISLPAKSEIEILNVEGQILKRLYVNDNHAAIDVSAFSKGMYFVNVKNNVGVVMKKFVKE